MTICKLCNCFYRMEWNLGSMVRSAGITGVREAVPNGRLAIIISYQIHITYLYY